MTDHMSVELFDVDDLTDMLDQVVTALRLTDVAREEPRDFPASVGHRAFTSQRAIGSVGAVRVHVTAFTYLQDPAS